MVSCNWLWAQSDDNVTETKPTFKEFKKKLDDKIDVIKKEKGIKQVAIEMERYGEMLVKNYPEEYDAYEYYVMVLLFSKNRDQEDRMRQKLLNLHKDHRIPPELAEMAKFYVEFFTATRSSNVVQKKELLEKLLLTLSNSENPHITEIVQIVNIEIEEVKVVLFEEELLGKPLDIKFEALDGRTVDLSKMNGKVVLIDFWAAWCGPCVRKIPSIKKIYDKFQRRGFEVIGISLDRDRKKLETFVSENNIPWPQFFDGKGWKNRLAKKYGIRCVPTLWLVDKQGNLVDVYNSTKLHNLEEKVKKYLAQ